MLPRICLCVLCTLLCAAVTTADSTLSTTTDGTLEKRPPADITSNDMPPPALDKSPDLDAEQKKLARQALRRKRKRLRKLREKVRSLRAELFQESNTVDQLVESNDGTNSSQPTSANSLAKKQQKKSGSRIRTRDAKWRKRIMKQLAQVVRRLDRLESQTENQQDKKTALGQSGSKASQRPASGQKMSKKDRREERKRRRQEMRLRKFVDKANGRGVDAPSGKKKKRIRFDPVILTDPSTKLDKLHSSINQSLSGDQGGPCIGHRDCKPGLCCHSSKTNNGTVKFCVLHGYLNGVQCDDSCQCSAGLHCFKVANDPSPADLQLPPTLAELQPHAAARCKKASTEDVLHGVYLNAKDAAFDTLPFPQ